MATADAVKTKIQGLINSANAVTGQSDADMTTAVATLIAGYGSSGESEGGSGTVFYTGTYMTEERVVQDITFSTPGGVTHFVMFLFDEPAYDTSMAFLASLAGSKDGNLIRSGSGNTGVTISACSYVKNTGVEEGLYYSIQFGTDSVTLIASSSTTKYVRAPLANKTYVWAAW